MTMTHDDFYTADEINHSVLIGNKEIILNPLSFKLFEVLASHANCIVPTEAITKAVWGNTVVSSETLKQRIFVLRKALSQASIDAVSIQSVRGKGYRLVVKAQKSAPTHNKPVFHFKTWALSRPSWLNVSAFVSGLSVLIIVAGFIFSAQKSDDSSRINNRVVLWANLDVNNMPVLARELYAQWFAMLTAQMTDSSLQLVLSSRQETLPIQVQSRKDRAALISFFEVIETPQGAVVNLSIAEPTTATILRTSQLSFDEDVNHDGVLQSHLLGIKSLVASNKLTLDKTQREHASNGIWEELRTLANQT